MRTKIIVLSSVAAAALLVGAVSPAAALVRPQVFSLVDVTESEVALDPGASFESGLPRAGARIAFTDGLYRWAGRSRGARVGRIEVLCTFTKVDRAAQAVTAYCNGTAFLPAGKILLAAHLRFTEESGASTVVVLGGTGRYAGARGFAKITDLPSGNSSIEFHLLP